MLQCHLSLWVRYRPPSRTWFRILVYWPETRSILHHLKSWKVINDILKWDNVQDFRNSSKLFTPKNSSEADLISNKYDIKGAIWTDFVRVDPLSFYREFYRLLRFLSNFVFDKIKKVHQEKNISFNKNQNFHRVITKDFGTMLEWQNLANSKMEFS